MKRDARMHPSEVAIVDAPATEPRRVLKMDDAGIKAARKHIAEGPADPRDFTQRARGTR